MSQEQNMKLNELFTIRIALGDSSVIGNGPSGLRVIAEVAAGTFEGERLRGTVLTPGADWVVLGDGYGEVDVRLNLLCDDGARIYMRYTGVLEQNEAAQSALAGNGETSYGDHYFVTQPRFECGQAGYEWLNRTVAIAEGRLIKGEVEYRVFECQPG
jgi:hypothetical protein